MCRLAHTALVVREYTEVQRFELVEDIAEQDKRWVTIRPPNAPPYATAILLARASTDREAEHIGNQTGGRVAALCYALIP